MNAKIYSLLKEYGLQDKEIKVYAILVDKGELTAYRIAKQTNIHRSTTYDILERLTSKGFVSKVEKAGKMYYSANEISAIIARLKDKESILVSLIPEFERLEKHVEPAVRILAGSDGQKQFNFSLFNLAKERKIKQCYVIGAGPAANLSLNIFINRLIKETGRARLQKIVEYKGIWNSRFRRDKLVKEYNLLGENRFLENLPSKVTTIVYGDYVAFLFTTDKPHVIEIQNKLIAEEFKSYFDFLWIQAKP